MKYFSFRLNGEQLSQLVTGTSQFPAYSGTGVHRNKKLSQCIPELGPIPSGQYYIIDRQSGGLLGPLRDLFSGKDEWFALYAIDKKIDDTTFCDMVKRGQFRLHPEGPLGISEGCVTIKSKAEYKKLRPIITNTKMMRIPNSKIETYGILTVA